MGLSNEVVQETDEYLNLDRQGLALKMLGLWTPYSSKKSQKAEEAEKAPHGQLLKDTVP